MTYEATRLANRVIAILRASPRISLVALSREIGVDRHTVEKAIRLQTGKTFGKMAHTYLFEKICEILRYDQNATIKEVSFKVGYKSPRSLDRFVLATCGLTPVLLRQKLARLASVPPYNATKVH